MVLAHFAKLLELPIENVDLLLKEAKHKFGGTHMVINGELLWIDQIFKDSIICVNIDTKARAIDNVSSIVPFLPPTGLYFPTESESISLRKIATKQWRKSFCWDLYSSNKKGTSTPYKIFKALSENNANTFNGIVFNKGTVYYLDKEIGYRDSKDVYHVIPEFYQELVDLFGEDRIVTDKVLPKKKELSKMKMTEIKLPDYTQPIATKKLQKVGNYLVQGEATITVNSYTNQVVTSGKLGQIGKKLSMIIDEVNNG